MKKAYGMYSHYEEPYEYWRLQLDKDNNGLFKLIDQNGVPGNEDKTIKHLFSYDEKNQTCMLASKITTISQPEDPRFRIINIEQAAATIAVMIMKDRYKEDYLILFKDENKLWPVLDEDEKLLKQKFIRLLSEDGASMFEKLYDYISKLLLKSNLGIK